MICHETTVIGGTKTSEGFICHKMHPEQGFDMPVVLAIDSDNGVAEMIKNQPPLRMKNGKLVYALPGGGIYHG